MHRRGVRSSHATAPPQKKSPICAKYHHFPCVHEQNADFAFRTGSYRSLALPPSRGDGGGEPPRLCAVRRAAVQLQYLPHHGEPFGGLRRGEPFPEVRRFPGLLLLHHNGDVRPERGGAAPRAAIADIVALKVVERRGTRRHLEGPERYIVRFGRNALVSPQPPPPGLQRPASGHLLDVALSPRQSTPLGPTGYQRGAQWHGLAARRNRCTASSAIGGSTEASAAEDNPDGRIPPTHETTTRCFEPHRRCGCIADRDDSRRERTERSRKPRGRRCVCCDRKATLSCSATSEEEPRAHVGRHGQRRPQRHQPSKPERDEDQRAPPES